MPLLRTQRNWSAKARSICRLNSRREIKIDENLPVELVRDLRVLGYDADTVTDEGLRGAADAAVVDAALTADRVLFTLDKGIANLKTYPIQQHAGVVLFRPDTSGRGAVIAFVRQRLREVLEMDLKGRPAIVGPSRIRFR